MERPANEKQNAKRISDVENCFGTDGQELAAPERFLIGEATLTKVCRKKPKQRKFFLFNDILVYGNILIDKKKYYNQHIIPLEEIHLESLDNTDELKNAWLIKGKIKSFVVYTETASEKKEWITYMNLTIQDRLKKCGKPRIEVHAPVWIPDSKATVCMNCNVTKFTVINRRHHCRNCGKVVCDTCSNKKIELPNVSKKQERVCLTCFDILTNVNDDSDSDSSQIMTYKLNLIADE